MTMTKSQRKKVNAKKQQLKEELHDIELYETDDLYCSNDSKSLKISFPHKFTKKQRDFIRLSLDKKVKVLFVDGPAGCAKTILSVYCGLMLLKEENYEDIVYVRSIIESAERGMGFLPGDIADKISPYLKPLEEKLEELLAPEDVNQLRKNNRISALPINYMRGIDFRPREMGKSGKVIIADEMQNCSWREIFTFLSRIGENCKVFVCGDPMQSDIKYSGMKDIMDAFRNDESTENGIYTFKFTENDIVRSELVKFIVKMLDPQKK